MAVVMSILDAAGKSYYHTFQERLDDVCKVGRVFSVYPGTGKVEKEHSRLRPCHFPLSGRLLKRAKKKWRKKGVTVNASTHFINVAAEETGEDFRPVDCIFAEVDVKNLLRRKTARCLEKRGLLPTPGNDIEEDSSLTAPVTQLYSLDKIRLLYCVEETKPSNVKKTSVTLPNSCCPECTELYDWASLFYSENPFTFPCFPNAWYRMK